jgi:hypothetical protein
LRATATDESARPSLRIYAANSLKKALSRAFFVLQRLRFALRAEAAIVRAAYGRDVQKKGVGLRWPLA